MRLPELQQEMQLGATLLVPNQRAARAWRRRLLDTSAPGELRVFPWGAWTSALWQEVLLRGKDERILLSPLQNTQLWTEVVHAAQPGTLRPLRSLVRLCTAAQHLLHQYLAADRLAGSQTFPGTDTATFAEWFDGYATRCRDERLLPAAAVEEALALHGSADVRGPVFLLGFDRLLPAQTLLLDRLRGDGIAVTALDIAEVCDIPEATPVVLKCADGSEELQILASSLSEELAAAPTGHDAEVLLILPDAEASRAAVDRVLRSVLGESSAWEFAAGLPLRSLPMIAAALDLLRWTQGPLPADTVAALLQSPYLDLRIDREHAGELDAALLRDNRRLRPEWTVSALAHRLKQNGSPLRDALLGVEATAAQQLRGRHLPGAWSVRVREVLTAAGWPGTRERTSAEYQLVDRWAELLDSLATLDLFHQPISFSEFLELLENTAADTLFAPENTGAPLQIATPSESAGTTAGALWFAHATEAQWSSRRTASPLLPWPLQVEFGMPGTDPARDAEEHRVTTRRLLAAAPEVRLSYAAMNADGELRPSPVLHDLKDARFEEASSPEKAVTDLPLEEFVDDTALPSLPAGTVPGGVGVLRDQAACAFRAFAQRRLFSSEPETPALGFDPRQRGELLHKVLQTFWNEVKTQAELQRQIGTGELEANLHRHIDGALSAPATTDSWNSAYLDLQRRRLFSVLRAWLEMEAKRPPFRVLHTEREVREVEVGSLRVDMRVDRIDEIERDGEPVLALIDYKTGDASPSDWMGDRPDEPQLPLYAVAANLENVGAIAFAAVRPGAKTMGLRALPVSTELLFPGKTDKRPELFEAQMEEWYATVHRLGEEFARGDARVGPKQYPGTCTFCGQRMLCRLRPDELEDLAEEDTAETGA